MIRKTGILSLIFSPILGVILLPIVLLFVLINEFTRLIVTCILFVEHNDLIELVAEGSDGFWGYKKKGSTRNVIVFLVAPEGSFTQEYITKFYREEIQPFKNGLHRCYEKFEKILITCCGYSCWKKAKNFDVSNHIRVLDKNKLYSSEDVERCLTQFGDDFGEDKPQWELIIIPKFYDGSGENKSILFVRYLHAYMDGLSTLMLFKERILTSTEYVIDPVGFKFPWWKKLVMYVFFGIYGPYSIVVTNIERFINTPWILRNDLKEPRRKFYAWAKSKPITFSMIRKIREQGEKASVTDIISTAFAIAAKKVLKERLVDELLVSDLVAYVPYPDIRPQNRYTYFTFPILTTNKESAYEKLFKVKRDSLECIKSPDILINYYLFKVCGRFPSFVFPFFLHGSNASLLLSNVPFSKRTVTLPTNTPVLSVGGFTPHPTDLGLSITTTRYGEEIKFFAVADSTWLSQEELSRLIDRIPVEIIQMAKETGFEDATTNSYIRTVDC